MHFKTVVHYQMNITNISVLIQACSFTVADGQTLYMKQKFHFMETNMYMKFILLGHKRLSIDITQKSQRDVRRDGPSLIL